ncbi:MAG: CerR family C-terminal domain-containing protein [Phycisphaerales bacterium]|nr:MAG: CerR family C-terminal domain-containing protein [Phycisphaerales bacterium]
MIRSRGRPTLATMTGQANPTRQALLEAAEHLFSQEGYAAVGIREIARQAGVNLAAIKYHFGSKHDLYLETVRAAMEQHGDELMDVLADPPADREDAAVRLVRFIYLFFDRLRDLQEVDACGLLMIREALRPSEAIDAVVRDYLQPSTRQMTEVLTVLAPDASEAEAERCVTSLMGQLLHYRIFRPFIERLRGVDFADGKVAAESAGQVAEFTLRGLGCEAGLIERAMKRAEAEAAAIDKGTKS